MKDNEQSEFWEKRLAADPNNFILKRLVSMTSHEQAQTPFKLPEFEDQDPVKLGREGYCHIALEVLLELYPTGETYRLTNDHKGYDHVFLMLNGQPLDMCGRTSIAEMRTYYKVDSLVPEAASFQDIQKYFRGWETPEEKTRLKAYFKKHILDNLNLKFPPRETQTTN